MTLRRIPIPAGLRQNTPEARAERNRLRAERAAMTNPCDRIAFDNQSAGLMLPLGLVLMAFEEEDAR